MSARSVPSGMRPSLSHSRRAISEPPRRPETDDLHALGAGLHGPLDGLLDGLAEGDAAGQLLGDVGRHEDGVELGLADLLDLQLDLAVVSLPICWRSASTLAPPLPMTMPGLAVWTVTVTWLMPRSMSTRLTLALASRLRDQLADGDVFLEQVGVVLVGVPLGVPRARDAEAEAVWDGPCVPCLGLPVLDHDGDVGHRLVDGEGAALGARRKRLMRRALVGDRLDDDRSSADRSWLFSALAAALLSTLATSCAAPWGMNRRMRRGLVDGHARRSPGSPGGSCASSGGGTWRWRKLASAGSYFSAVERSVCLPCPRKVRVGANSPRRWPTMFSVT